MGKHCIGKKNKYLVELTVSPRIAPQFNIFLFLDPAGGNNPAKNYPYVVLTLRSTSNTYLKKGKIRSFRGQCG